MRNGEISDCFTQIALHAASTYGGAQFYISCAQLNVVNGGSGTPGPLVSIPGVYTGVCSTHFELIRLVSHPILFSTVRAGNFAQYLQFAEELHRLPISCVTPLW